MDIEDKGHPNDDVCVNIKIHHDGSHEFSQLALIDSILDDIGINNLREIKPVHMSPSKHIHANAEFKPFYESERFHFNHHSVIGKLNFVAPTLRPDIIFVVHQLA